MGKTANKPGRSPLTAAHPLLPWVLSGSLYLVYVVLGMYLAAIGPTINDLAAQNGVDVKLFSSVFLIRTIGALVGSILGARFYDRISAKLLLIIMLAVCALFFIGMPLVTVFFMTAFIFFVLGFAYSMLAAAGNIIITRIHGTRSAPFLSGLHFSFGIGAFLIPLLIAQIRRHTGTSVYAYWFIAAAALLVVVFIGTLPAPPHEKSQTAHIHRHMRWDFILLAVFFFFFFVGVEIAFGSWIFNYSLYRGITNDESAAYLTSLFYGVYTATRFAVIPLAALIDNKKILIVSLSGALAACIFLFFSPTVTWVIFATTAGIAFFLAPVVPLTLSLIDKKSGLTGKVTGYLQIGMVTGGAVFAWIMGQLLTPAAHYVFPLILGISMSAALGTGIALIKFRTKTQN